MSPAASAFRRCACGPRRSPAAIRTARLGGAAARAALARAGMSVGDLGFVEITEAFAAQLLAVSDDLGLDEETIRATAERSRSAIRGARPAPSCSSTRRGCSRMARDATAAAGPRRARSAAARASR